MDMKKRLEEKFFKDNRDRMAKIGMFGPRISYITKEIMSDVDIKESSRYEKTKNITVIEGVVPVFRLPHDPLLIDILSTMGDDIKKFFNQAEKPTVVYTPFGYFMLIDAPHFHTYSKIQDGECNAWERLKEEFADRKSLFEKKLAGFEWLNVEAKALRPLAVKNAMNHIALCGCFTMATAAMASGEDLNDALDARVLLPILFTESCGWTSRKGEVQPIELPLKRLFHLLQLFILYCEEIEERIRDIDFMEYDFESPGSIRGRRIQKLKKLGLEMI